MIDAFIFCLSTNYRKPKNGLSCLCISLDIKQKKEVMAVIIRWRSSKQLEKVYLSKRHKQHYHYEWFPKRRNKPPIFR